MKIKNIEIPDTVLNRHNAMKAIGNTIPVPFSVGSAFNTKHIYVNSDGIGLVEGGDVVSLDDARKALEFMVNQLGGAVVWGEE